MKDYVIRNEKWYPYMIKKHTLILIFVNCSQTQKSGLRKSRKPHIYYSLVRLAGVEPARPKALPPEDSVSAIPPQPHLEYFVIVL